MGGSRIAGPLVAAAIVAYPVTVVTVPHAGSAIFAVLVLAGVATLAQEGVRPLRPEEKLLFLLVAGFVAVALLAFLLGGRLDTGVSKLRRYLRFLGLIPIYLLILRARPRETWVFTGLGLGAVVCGLFAIWDGGWIDRPPDYRVTGATHFILFGDLSLSMGFMAFAGWLPGKRGILPVAALILGIVASLFSGTRGAWLAVPGLVLVTFWYHWPSMTRRLRVGLIVGTLAVTTVAYWVPQTGVRDRARIAAHEVQCYLAGESCYGASGGRLDMWQAAWRMFRARPLLGVGVGGYPPMAREYAARGEMIEIVSRLNHPHNEYMSVLASRGLVGLTALLALWLAPLSWYYRAARDRAGAHSRAGLAGMLLVVALAQFALTESIFERSRPITFFVLYTALVCCLVLRPDGEAGREPASGLTTGAVRDS